MPSKTAKTSVKAAGSKATASKAAHKPAAPKPAPKAAAKPVAKPVAVKPAAKPVAIVAKVEEPKRVLTQRQGFKTNEFVVYPAHGVGQILAIEDQEIAGAKLELFVINFMKDKMTLRVPTAKVANVGMRKLSEPALVKKALETLKGRARIQNSPTANASSMKQRWIGCRARSRWCSTSPRPKRSRRSKASSPRARGVGQRPKRKPARKARAIPTRMLTPRGMMQRWRTRRRKAPSKLQDHESPARKVGLFVARWYAAPT
jgi:hypothetical protein